MVGATQGHRGTPIEMALCVAVLGGEFARSRRAIGFVEHENEVAHELHDFTNTLVVNLFGSVFGPVVVVAYAGAYGKRRYAQTRKWFGVGSHQG